MGVAAFYCTHSMEMWQMQSMNRWDISLHWEDSKCSTRPASLPTRAALSCISSLMMLLWAERKLYLLASLRLVWGMIILWCGWVLIGQIEKKTNCEINRGMINCTGVRYALFTRPKPWNITFIYRIDQKRNLDIMYNVKFYQSREGRPHPFAPQVQHICSTHVTYTKAVLPSVAWQMHYDVQE